MVIGTSLWRKSNRQKTDKEVGETKKVSEASTVVVVVAPLMDWPGLNFGDRPTSAAEFQHLSPNFCRLNI